MDDAGQERPDDPPAPVSALPLPAVEAVLQQVADAIHDRPVQQLVAAKLMVETVGAMGGGPVAEGPAAGAPTAGEAGDLLVRAATAIGRAGEQSRDLMWALAAPVLRAGHLAEDAEDALTRTGGPISVDVRAAADAERVTAVVRAAHRLLAGCLLAGTKDVSVAVAADATAASAHLSTPIGGTLRPTADGSWTIQTPG